MSKTHSILAPIQQKLVALYGPDNYYTTRYSGEEAGYVGAIPWWMWKQSHKLGDVLDIGPAYGTLACLASSLNAKSVTTLDRVPFMSLEVIDTFHLIALEGDIERNCPTLAPDTYDTVIMTEVLEHLNFHPLQTLTKIAASLRHGGIMYLSTPNRDSWGAITHRYKEIGAMPSYDEAKHANAPWHDEHIWHYSDYELRSMFNFIGLNVVGWTESVSPGGKHFNVGLYKP